MNIYESQKVLPYVYICTHKVTGEFYIGYREANKLPSHQDLPKYRTSSKKVKPRFDEFDWQVIAEFLDGESAYKFEQMLIAETFYDSLSLNGNYHIIGSHFKNHEASQYAKSLKSDSTKQKMSIAKLHKSKSLAHRHAMSIAHFGKVKSSSAIENYIKARVLSNDRNYVLISPSNEIIETSNLKQFCKDLDLSYSLLYKKFSTHDSLSIQIDNRIKNYKYPKTAGWRCLEIRPLKMD